MGVLRPTLYGGAAFPPARIASVPPRSYDSAMPTLIFWLLVFGAVAFFKLTTKAERGEMVLSFWTIIAIVGTLGFAWQLLEWGGLTR